jgi:hypothetical protein
MSRRNWDHARQSKRMAERGTEDRAADVDALAPLRRTARPQVSKGELRALAEQAAADFVKPQAATATVIAEWPKNQREVVRVALDSYMSKPTIAVRVWYRHDGTGELRPGRAGLTLAVRHLPVLAHALNDALRQAYSLGVLSPDQIDDG